MNSVQNFLRWEERSIDVIGVKRCYVNIAGDLATGVLLSQIVYWFLPSKKTGNPRVTIDREGRNWLAKKRDEWWEECCVTPKQFDRSIEILESLGIVTTALFKFSGSPTKHISLNFDRLIELIERGENGISPNSKNEVTEGVNSNLPLREELITETTAETTQRLPTSEKLENLPDWIPTDAWNGWMEVRKNLKKNGKKIAWTPRCEKIAIDKLEEWYNQGYNLTTILDAATFGSWQGLYLPKDDQGATIKPVRKKYRRGDPNNPADWLAAQVREEF